ncbi:MAG: hypothetical protein ACOVP4_13950 [Bacteriovoracaceae bacterium]
MKKIIFGLTSLGMIASAHADITPSCKKVVYDAVLRKALKVSNTASVDGHKVIYGNDKYNPAFREVVVVLASDETEASHYIVVTQKNKNTCSIIHNDISADGSLPPVDGLND